MPHFYRGPSIAYSLAALAIFLAYGGCSSDESVANSTKTTISIDVGMGGGRCNGDVPDGICVPSGPQAEDCGCLDCKTAALCTKLCIDDDKCDIGTDDGTEDCSCNDCYAKTQDCAPRERSCDDDPGCQYNENCTCPDCTDTPFCTDGCVDNGECLPWLEGCSCQDCANTEACGVTGGGGKGTGGSGVGGKNTGGTAAGGAATGGAGGS